mmetsp:Transcript_27295/g.26338  ORF Transcript_27295/g.26338 Transcript_27295/m.26338 type:complete len:121 (+) Transcript_27295:198-560(+)
MLPILSEHFIYQGQTSLNVLLNQHQVRVLTQSVWAYQIVAFHAFIEQKLQLMDVSKSVRPSILLFLAEQEVCQELLILVRDACRSLRLLCEAAQEFLYELNVPRISLAVDIHIHILFIGI